MDVALPVLSYINLNNIVLKVSEFNTKWGKYASPNTVKQLIRFLEWAELYLQIMGKIQTDFNQLAYKNEQSYDIMEENLLKTRLDTLRLGAQIVGYLSNNFFEEAYRLQERHKALRTNTQFNYEPQYAKDYAKLLSTLTGCSSTYGGTDYKEFFLAEITDLQRISNYRFSKNVVEVLSDERRNSLRQLSREFLKQLEATKKEFEQNCNKFYKEMHLK